MHLGIAKNKTMSQEIDLCEGGSDRKSNSDSDSDDNGDWSNKNTASVPSSLSSLSRKRSLPLSRKRTQDEEESFNDAHPRNENGSVLAFVVAGSSHNSNFSSVEVPQHNERRGGVARSSKASGKNVAAGKCAQSRKGVAATVKAVIVSEDAQVANHSESHEGIAALIAASSSEPINSKPEQTSQDDRSANKHSQRRSTSIPPPNASGRQRRYSTWEDRLSELADYRVKHGHCNVPRRYNENSKLGNWVQAQRYQYRFHLDGETSAMTAFRIRELESLDFDWGDCVIAWEDRLSELDEYRKIHGHCNVPRNDSENGKLGTWATTQRTHYRLYKEGKKSSMTTFRIQELESLGFEWVVCVTSWEDRLSELAVFRKKNGHCNATKMNSENTKLGRWVGNQRTHYKSLLEGKKSQMTTFRIRELENLGFEWMSSVSRGKGTANKKRSKGIQRNQVDVAFEPEESELNGEVDPVYIPSHTAEI
jgi:hypothetical protein